MRDLKQDILDFWFVETPPQQWFRHDPDFSARLRTDFLPVYEQGRAGAWEGWKSSPDGALALVILFDQVPRHVFRGTAQAFETDALALAVAREAVQRGLDQLLEPVKRGFLYVPFQHSEDPAVQAESLKLYTRMKEDNPAGYMYGVRHYDAVARFGRFPNRNTVLGRQNTPEESEWLQDFEARGRLF